MGSLVQQVDWVALGPTLVVALGALAVLLADLWVSSERRARLRWPTLGIVIIAGVLLVLQLDQERSTFCVDPGSGLLACSFVVEPITWALQAVSLVGAAVVILLPIHDEGLPAARSRLGRLAGEYHFLLLAALAGSMTIAAARDVITLVIALEVLSLPAFAMIALPAGRRGADPAAAEAALKAFLVSVVSLAVMVFGAAMLYGVTGTLHLEPMAAALAQGTESTTVAAVGATLVLAGLLFKVAAVPFHGWVPDVYVGAPVRVAAFLSTVSKSGGFAGLLIVLWVGLRPYGGAWGPVLALLAALTMTIGNLGALRQDHAVRMLAWSSIAQSGFMLVPLAAAGIADASGGVRLDGAAASIAYLAIYAITNLGAFAVVALVVSRAVDRRVAAGGTREAIAEDGPADRLAISSYAGLVRRHGFAALALAFFLLSLAGLPPGVAGLVAKVVIFQSAVDAGLGWLAVIMAVNVVLGLAYYLRWTAVALTPTARAERRSFVAAAPRLPLVAIGSALAVGIVLSVWPQAVLAIL